MPNARAKNAAAEAVEAAPNGEVASTITFVDALPEKPKVTRQSWWDSITPQLDARPGEWALVYTGVGDDDTKADRNALSRVVRTRRSLKDADLLDTTYSIEKRGNKVYAQRVA